MPAPVGQNNWRFCTKCYCLWFNGAPTNGVCAAGGQHDATTSTAGPSTAPAARQGGGAGWDYVLVADPTPFGGTE
jgi:hypothetical protein